MTSANINSITIDGRVVVKSKTINRDTDAPSSKQFGQEMLVYHDKDGEYIGYIQPVRTIDDMIGLQISPVNEKSDGTPSTGMFTIYVDRQGNTYYDVNNPENFCSAIGALALTGGTMTGDLDMDDSAIEIMDSNIDIGTAPPSPVYDRVFRVVDKNGDSVGFLQATQTASGSHYNCFGAPNSNDSGQNQLMLGWDVNDNPKIFLSYPGIFRDAINTAAVFIKSSWSTSSDQTMLPETPCFVLDTSTNAMYWCDGTDISQLGYLPLSGGTMSGAINMGSNNIENVERIYANYHQLTESGQYRGNIYVSGDYLYIQGYDTSGVSTCQYRFNLTDWGIAYREYANNAWGSWESHIYNATASRTKNTFLAAPNTADGAATFRVLSTLDLPIISITTATTSSTAAPYAYTFDMSAHAAYALSMTSSVSVPNSTWKELVRIRFTNNATTGTLYVKVRWASNTTGQRYIGHSSASSTSDLAAPSTNTAPSVSYPAPSLRMSYTYPVGNVSAGTYVSIYAYQNSGGALNVEQVYVRYLAYSR